MDVRSCGSGTYKPPAAHKVLEAENEIDTMLPCNVIVQESDDGQTEIAAVDPVAFTWALDNEAFRPIAEEIRTRLERAVDQI